MIGIKDFKRLIRPIQNKIFLLLGRAILTAVNNSESTQKIQIVALSGEVITDIERFQEYGFESYPLEGAEVFAGFINGNRDNGIVLCVHDRRYRPTDLAEGEVAVYTDEDKTTPFRVQMKRNRTYFRRSDKVDIDIDTSKTEDIGTTTTETIGTSKTVTAPIEENVNATSHTRTAAISTHTNATSHTRTAATELHTNATQFSVVSPIVSLSSANFAGLRSFVDERFATLFNSHVHAKGGGIGNSGTPTTTLGASHLTSKVKGE